MGLLSKFQALSSLFWRAKGVSQSSTLHSESSKTMAPWFGNCAAIFWQVAGNGGPLLTLFGSLALALEFRKLFEPKSNHILCRRQKFQYFYLNLQLHLSDSMSSLRYSVLSSSSRSLINKSLLAGAVKVYSPSEKSESL